MQEALDYKILNWLSRGANPPLPLDKAETYFVSKDFLDSTHICTIRVYAKSTSNIKENASNNLIKAYLYTINGKVRLIGEMLVFEHISGYSSMNSYEYNKKIKGFIHEEFMNNSDF